MQLDSNQSRRKFLKNVGFISVGFSFLGSCVSTDEELESAARVAYTGDFPGSLEGAKSVNAWIEVLQDGRVRVLSGKVELGQGIRTAIRQVAAEELDMDLNNVEVKLAETGVTPNEGYTAASASIINSAMSVRYAAATARMELLKIASKKLGLPTKELVLANGVVSAKSNNMSLSFSELLDGVQIETEVNTPVQVKDKSEYKYVGKTVHRNDIEKIVRGEEVYIQDLRFPGMVHARVVRPPNYESKLLSSNKSQLKNSVPGILKVVENGSFLGVIAEEEYQAVKAEKYLKENSEWEVPKIFPKKENLYEEIKKIADKPRNIQNDGDLEKVFQSKDSLKATFTKAYQKHGSMGPATAIALYDGDLLHIWSHSQGIYPMRDALSSMLQMDKEKIHVTSAPGAGCFGHSTADDAAADAAILALDYPGKHVRIQWSRSDEYSWDPYGSAVITQVEASLDKNGKIDAWKSDVWTDSHSTRPNSDGGTLLPGRYLINPISMQSRGYLAGGHRNGDPYYDLPNLKLDAHYFDGPLRVSSLRSLGAFTNVIAIESCMDELAERAGKDPIDFRMEHLTDKRASAVIERVKQLTNAETLLEGEGLGYGFIRYKNTDAYAAVGAKVAVDKTNGKVKVIKLWGAVDVGEVINLDGIRNQTEGGMLQAASWVLKEEVSFSETKITSVDWNNYPVFRFQDIPEVEVAVIDRPDEPAVGGGEVALPPAGAAIANAIYNACGFRAYDFPITAEKILTR